MRAQPSRAESVPTENVDAVGRKRRNGSADTCRAADYAGQFMPFGPYRPRFGTDPACPERLACALQIGGQENNSCWLRPPIRSVPQQSQHVMCSTRLHPAQIPETHRRHRIRHSTPVWRQFCRTGRHPCRQPDRDRYLHEILAEPRHPWSLHRRTPGRMRLRRIECRVRRHSRHRQNGLGQGTRSCSRQCRCPRRRRMTRGRMMHRMPMQTTRPRPGLPTRRPR